MNIHQHHCKARCFLAEKQQNSESLLNIINEDFSGLPNWWCKEKIQNAAPTAFSCYLSYFTQAVMLDWPKAHCIWLLAHAAEIGQMHFRMLANIGELTPVTLAGRDLAITPYESSSFNSPGLWLDVCNMNIILGGQQDALNELCIHQSVIVDSNPAEQIDAYDAMYNVYRSYMMDDLTPAQQLHALQTALAFSERGKVAAMHFIEAEYAIQFMHLPKVSLIASCWGRQSDTVSHVAAKAVEAHYDYFADFAPEPGEPRGTDSIELYDSKAMVMRDIIALLALHFQRTGESPDFDSPYIPSWLIKGEFPSREAVLFDNPPEFTLQALGL